MKIIKHYQGWAIVSLDFAPETPSDAGAGLRWGHFATRRAARERLQYLKTLKG